MLCFADARTTHAPRTHHARTDRGVPGGLRPPPETLRWGGSAQKAHLEQLAAFLAYKLSVIARSHPTCGAASCGGLPGHELWLLIGGLGGGPLLAASRDDLTGATTWQPMAAGTRTLATADVQLAMTENFNTALEAVLGAAAGVAVC